MCRSSSRGLDDGSGKELIEAPVRFAKRAATTTSGGEAARRKVAAGNMLVPAGRESYHYYAGKNS